MRYHVHLFRTWRTTDQKVRLKIPSADHTDYNHQTVPTKPPGKTTNKETMV